jgi:cobalt transporter subunit CbtA
MIQRMLISALLAGAIAGLFAALLHFAFVQNFILVGERYESGVATHFATTGATTADHDHAAHDHGTPDLTGAPLGLGRDGLTVAFAALLYVGYGLVLVAGFALAETMGHRITPAASLLWGVGGFAAVQLAPAMGLSPVLPGTLAADLTARQIWWAGTVAATALGLGALAYGRGPLALALAGLLLARPHLIGAPLPDGYYGAAPPEVAAAFAARSLGTGLAVWALLGWLAGRFWTARAA